MFVLDETCSCEGRSPAPPVVDRRNVGTRLLPSQEHGVSHNRRWPSADICSRHPGLEPGSRFLAFIRELSGTPDQVRGDVALVATNALPSL